MKLLGADQIERLRLELVLAVLVDSEDVVQCSVAAQSHVHVEAEQKVIARSDHVARRTVVVGGDALSPQQFGLDRAEDILAGHR